MEYLAEKNWKEKRAAYESAIIPFTSSYRERKGRGLSHPVYDFLFSYYTYSSKKLERWHPGYKISLECSDELKGEFLQENSPYEEIFSGSKSFISASVKNIRDREVKQLLWVRELCKSIESRSPRFSCLGLHEWAMVYKIPDIRHPYPLRLSDSELEAFVESSTVTCSHFDAFRFFTPKAIGLNVLQPTADSRLAYEQGGCLHANMDLYKWAFKLIPWISSELLAKCFFLALETREIDMRASPYDFLMLGFQPIKIETPAGQEEYKSAQRDIALRASSLRSELISQIEVVLKDIPTDRQSFIFEEMKVQ